MQVTFVSGALMMGLLIVGIIFLRYWKESGQRLFLCFAVSFFLMAFERVILDLTETQNEGRSLVFLFRLAAFILIIVGIVDTNRAKRSRT